MRPRLLPLPHSALPSLRLRAPQSNEAFALVYHKLYNISCAGLRFFTVYGPWGRPDMAYFSFAHRMVHGLPIQVYGHGKPRRDFTYVDDIVTGIVGAMALSARRPPRAAARRLACAHRHNPPRALARARTCLRSSRAL